MDSVLKLSFRNEVVVVDRSGVLSACNAGDAAGASGSIPGWERSPREGSGNSFQYSCLAGYSPWCCRELDMTEQLNNNNHQKSGVNFLQL